MSDQLALARECQAVGRMLRAQPTQTMLAAFLEAFPVYEPANAEAVEQDYLRLFVGVGMPLAPPWESAWSSDARLLFQRETLDVRYWYRSVGLEITALHHEPDDHIGFELEFIGALLERDDMRTARSFAREHPLAWADRWAQAVQDNAQCAFCPALASHALTLLAQIEPASMA